MRPSMPKQAPTLIEAAPYAKENFVSDCAVDTKRRGARDLDLRLVDMDRDGSRRRTRLPLVGTDAAAHQ